MAGGVREFFQTGFGRFVATMLACVAVGVLVYVIYAYAGGGGEVTGGDRIFADASFDPPRPFKVNLTPGMQIPCESPLSHKQTGYPAELCYWTKEGTIKSEPTAVLLNETVGKPGPTFCPDCGRLVVGHNPQAAQGMQPPPTQAEYATSAAATTQPTTAPSRDGR